MVILLDARRRERGICRADFYERLLETIDRPDPAEPMPARGDRDAMRRRVASAEVDVIVETAGQRLARAEALAVNVGHRAAGAIRRAREALDGAERQPCS